MSAPTVITSPFRDPNLEKSKEFHMSERLRNICTGNSKVLAIIDFPRVSGILKALE